MFGLTPKSFSVMATDVLAFEQRLHHNHQLLLQQFDQHAADQQRQALAVLESVTQNKQSTQLPYSAPQLNSHNPLFILCPVCARQ